MAGRLLKLACALLAPFALASCVLAPGKFVSTLTLNADRSFTFSYVGEVYAIDPAKDFGKGMGDLDTEDDSNGDSTLDPGKSDFNEGDATLRQIALQSTENGGSEDPAATEAKNKAIADALSKEAGYRKVSYEGGGKFLIDYAITSTLTHSFAYPFNTDAEAVFPFIVIELRANNTVRVKAPGFANEGSNASVPGADQASNRLDGTFTLDTDAEIVSQNNEEGVVTKGARKTVTWIAKPTTKAAPMAVLRMK